MNGTPWTNLLPQNIIIKNISQIASASEPIHDVKVVGNILKSPNSLLTLVYSMKITDLVLYVCFESLISKTSILADSMFYIYILKSYLR
jgi:hypothetical protein